jgi:hypothetical protein
MCEKQYIEKTLSSNDLGLTGAHQAGILVPKNEIILGYFPRLDKLADNPRVSLRFLDGSGTYWKFNFIYYNNKFRGGTRNEYRLTGMTKFLNSAKLMPGDAVIFSKNEDDYMISYRRKTEIEMTIKDGIVKISLNDTWRIIEF